MSSFLATRRAGAFLLAAILGSSASGAVLPELAKPGVNGYVSSKMIYPTEGAPTPECHASTIVETKNGLVAAWFGGTREKNPDVGIWVARQVNGVWGAPFEVATGAEGESQDYACWNPVLFQPRNGPLMLFYKVGIDPRAWWGLVMTSTDEGETWTPARKLGLNRSIGPLLGPVKNKPVQLSDGTILAPSSTEIIKDGVTFWKIHFEISRDNGATWTVVGPINDGVAFDAIQPSILLHKDGSLQVMARSRESVVVQAWSKDKGRTWSDVSPTSLPNPNSGTDAVTLADGRHLLIYNHSVRAAEDRSVLHAALSTDGKDWRPVLTFETEPHPAGYSYPAVIQTSDGLVHVTYTYQRKSIKHVVIDPAKMR